MTNTFNPTVQYTTQNQINESLGLPKNSYSVKSVGPDMRKKPEINPISDILAKKKRQGDSPGDSIYDRLYKQNLEKSRIASLVKQEFSEAEKSKERIRKKHL